MEPVQIWLPQKSDASDVTDDHKSTINFISSPYDRCPSNFQVIVSKEAYVPKQTEGTHSYKTQVYILTDNFFIIAIWYKISQHQVVHHYNDHVAKA